jgi:Domain of unknown function (DUF4398)
MRDRAMVRIRVTGMHAFASLSAAFLLTASGCASMPKPTDKLALATAAIARAEQTGAVESAPLPLAAARDKLAQAQKLMNGPDSGYAEAGRLAEEADMDARLAEATAHAAKAQAASTELDKSIEALRQETSATGQ